MKKGLRTTSLIMLVVAIGWIALAFLTMGSTFVFPNWVNKILNVIYYLCF